MRYLRGLKLPYPSHAIILEEIIQQIGGLQERIARNVKCGGTAAQDSQSEANKGAYPPLPPTTCSASCPSLVVAEFIRQLETLRSELSCLLGTHLNRIVMWYGDDFHMDGSTIWGNPTRDPLFVALILRCLIGWHVSLVFAERSR